MVNDFKRLSVSKVHQLAEHFFGFLPLSACRMREPPEARKSMFTLFLGQEVGHAAEKNLRNLAHGFGEGRMRMDGQTHVLCEGAHFNG